MFARLFACGIAVFSLANLSNGSPTVTVGNPRDPDRLPQEILDAYKQGASRIVIRTGTYRFSRQGHPLLVLDAWKNAHLSGHGVTLVSAETDAGADLVRMVHCSGVGIEDLTFSQSQPVACQGKVSDVRRDGEGVSCVWRPDVGYGVPEAFKRAPAIVDGTTHALRIGSGDGGTAGLQAKGDGTFQVSLSKRTKLEDGDSFAASLGASPAKVHLLNCHDCTLSDLTLFRNGTHSIREELGGGNSYYDCHWQTGPKPDGAAEKPLVAVNGTGLESIGAYPGPDVENCDFAGITLGDCISVHGVYQTVQSSSGAALILGHGSLGLVPDQPVRVSAKGFFANAFVKSLTKNSDGTLTVVLYKDLQAPLGAKISNPLADGQSFKILNCHIGNTPARGISAMGDSGFIENNLIANCGSSAISAGPDYERNESDYVQDLTIKANQFKNNGFAISGNAAILVHGEGAIGNKNIDIEGNSFEGNFGGDIAIQWTSIATVRNNNFSSPSKRPEGFDRPIAISIGQSNSLRILDNLMKNDLLYPKPWIQAGPEVTGVDQQGLRS